MPPEAEYFADPAVREDSARLNATLQIAYIISACERSDWPLVR